MTQQNKKSPRKKAYKFMSVSELVASRKELSAKIEQIDAILNEAVEAVSNIPRMKNRHITMQNSSIDSAFAPQTYSVNQVPISKEAPVLDPISRTAADQSSGFSIFDAESAAREQARAETEYIQNHKEITVPTDSFDFNEEDISKEIESLKENIKNTLDNNV
jgi:hypothetical protein